MNQGNQTEYQYFGSIVVSGRLLHCSCSFSYLGAVSPSTTFPEHECFFTKGRTLYTAEAYANQATLNALSEWWAVFFYPS